MKSVACVFNVKKVNRAGAVVEVRQRMQGAPGLEPACIWLAGCTCAQERPLHPMHSLRVHARHELFGLHALACRGRRAATA